MRSLQARPQRPDLAVAGPGGPAPRPALGGSGDPARLEQAPSAGTVRLSLPLSACGLGRGRAGRGLPAWPQRPGLAVAGPDNRYRPGVVVPGRGGRARLRVFRGGRRRGPARGHRRPGAGLRRCWQAGLRSRAGAGGAARVPARPGRRCGRRQAGLTGAGLNSGGWSGSAGSSGSFLGLGSNQERDRLAGPGLGGRRGAARRGRAGPAGPPGRARADRQRWRRWPAAGLGRAGRRDGTSRQGRRLAGR